MKSTWISFITRVGQIWYFEILEVKELSYSYKTYDMEKYQFNAVRFIPQVTSNHNKGPDCLAGSKSLTSQLLQTTNTFIARPLTESPYKAFVQGIPLYIYTIIRKERLAESLIRLLEHIYPSHIFVFFFFYPYFRLG